MSNPRYIYIYKCFIIKIREIMNWLWVILIVAGIAAVLAYIGEQNEDEKGQAAVSGAFVGGMGCGYLILQILFGLFVFWVLFKLGAWLFG